MHRIDPHSRMPSLTHRRRRRAGFSVLLLLGAATGSLALRGKPARAQARAEFVPTFSTNTRVKQQVERLNRLAGQKLWDEWLGVYQQLVNDPQDLVMARDEEFLVGVRYHCHQLLAGLPPQVRQRYRALYDNEARQVYEKAEAAADGAGMRDVYSRFRFSSSANRALLWIANRALDDGSPELARVAYGIVAKDPAVGAGTLLRYALAAEGAGRPTEARAVLERVRKEYGPQPVRLAGQNSTGAEAAAQLLAGFGKRPGGDIATGSRWPAFGGTAGDRQMAGSLSGGVKRLWEFAQPTNVGAVSSYSYREARFGSANSPPRARFSFLTFPAVDGDRLWVQGPRNVTALKLGSGEPLWDQQDFLANPDDTARINANPRTGGVYYRSGRPVQAAPSVEGRLLVTRMPLSAIDGTSSRWPADFAIAALDTTSGRALWKRTAGEVNALYFNVPTLQANTVFTGVATYKGGMTEFNAVALEAGTGEPLWSTYLGGGSDALATTDGSPPAVRDGVVWIESTLHTLSALDLITGEIRHIYRYAPGRSQTLGLSPDASPQISNEPISLIASGSGPIVFAPRWGTDVIALDPATGKLLWSSPKAPGNSTMGSLFGVDKKHAYIGGGQILALNLADGAREWTWEPQASSSNVGFPALVGDRIYVPVEGRIHVRSAADGREAGVLDTSEFLGDSPGFTSVVAVGERLLVSTRDKVIAFGPR